MEDVLEAVQELIARTCPRADVGWEGSYQLFRHGGTSVLWLSAQSRHVSLGFSQGVDLPDPSSLLEGTGKTSRHVKLKSLEDVERPAVRALLEAAWARQPATEVLEEVLGRVRTLCLALPETKETVSHGHPTFWAGKKTFAVYGMGGASVSFKADAGLHLQLEGDERIFTPPYLGPSGWLAVQLDEETDWDQVRSVLEHSYRLVATRKLLAALGSASPEDDPGSGPARKGRRRG